MNMLFSFAQYEREIGAERTRDKIALSKKRGLWMGGTVPLGYDNVNKQLNINAKEAEIVRFVFNRYIETGSPIQIVEEAMDKGYKTKIRKTKSGNIGGKHLDTAAVYNIISNHTYLGKVKHFDNVYDGEHEAIISKEQWDKAHAMIGESPRNKKVHDQKTKKPPYLKGLLKCGICNSKMSCTYTTKGNGKQYRYYRLDAHASKSCTVCPNKNVVAGNIEKPVIHYISMLLKTSDMTIRVISALREETILCNEKQVVMALGAFDVLWEKLDDEERSKLIRAFIEKIIFFEGYADITFKTNDILSLFVQLTAYSEYSKESGASQLEIIDSSINFITIRIPINFEYSSSQTVFILPDDEQVIRKKRNYNEILVRAVTQSLGLLEQLESGEASNISDIAAQEKKDVSYIRRRLQLTCLAPDIIEKIIEGTQPKNLKINDLIGNFPSSWEEQRKALGM